MNLEWNVLIHDFNKDKIKKYNIFREDLFEDIKDAKCKTFGELREIIDKWAKYHYWAKAEYEIAVGGLHSKYPENFEKIDAYYQLKMNLDHIVNYINDYLEMNLD